MTSATDELRRLLDERGVEYRVSATGYSIDIGPSITAYANRTDTTLDVSLRGVTPEQAVEATLGRGTCHAVFEVDAMSEDERIGEYVCSECGETFGDVRDQQPNYCPNCGRRCVG